MKKQIILPIAALAMSVFACNNAPTETVAAEEAQEEIVAPASASVDTEASVIKWVGFKTVSNDQHNGTIKISEGSVGLEEGNLVGGNFTIDMNSIVDLDLEDAEYNAKLVGHLKSEDFFHAEAHPTASFAITGVRAEANEEKGTTHVISGNLTMRGVEKNISFPATVTITDAGVTIDAPEFAIDRKNWNVMFGSTGIVGLAKEKLIDDSILLTLNVQAKY